MTSPNQLTWDWMSEVWQRADSSGVFESGWTYDHFYSAPGDPSEDCMDGWITLTALLHQTAQLRGGVLVTAMAYRNPGVLANMASTLDITSGGRLELGLGAGWNEEESDAFGIRLGSRKERIDRFEEGLIVLESLFTNDRTTFAGQHYVLNEAMNNPKPLQRPLPVCIGGSGRQRTLPLVARYAHHWNYSYYDPAQFTELRSVLHEECAKIGRDPAEIRCSTLVRYECDDAAFRAEVDAWKGVGADLAIVKVPKTEPADVIDRIVELILAS